MLINLNSLNWEIFIRQILIELTLLLQCLPNIENISHLANVDAVLAKFFTIYFLVFSEESQLLNINVSLQISLNINLAFVS